MILKRLVLDHYKQHSKLDMSFTGNVVGIIGDNHSGKSNLLGAMHFAFGGEQPGFDRADLLQWGAATGYVDLYFNHNGVDGHIHRGLHNSEASFTYGKAKYASISKVRDAISEHLGLDKDLLKTIFVRQSEIDDVLFTDPRVRELAFQRLCGIGEAAKIHKQLGEILGAMATPPNYDEQIAEGTLRHAQMAAKINELQVLKKTMDAQRSTCMSMDDIRAQITAQDRIQSACTRLTELTNKSLHYTGLISTATAELATLPTDVLDLTETDKAIEETRNLIAQSNNYAKALAAWEDLGKKLMALGDAPVKAEDAYKPEQIEYLKKTINELRAVYNDAVGNLKLYKGVMAACKGVLSKDATCPLCGNQVTDTEYLATKIKLLEEKVVTTNPMKWEMDLETAFRTNQNNDAEYARLAQTYKSSFEIMGARYAEAEKTLDSLKEFAAVKDNVVQLTARLNTLQQQRQAFVATTARRSSLQANIKANQGYLVDIGKTIESERTALPNLLVGTPAELTVEAAQAKARVQMLNGAAEELRKIDEQLAQLTGMLVATEAGFNELTKTLADLEDRRAKQGAYKTTLETLGQVRDWFHYGNGPHTLANSVLNDMTADVNSFLEKFGALFSVVAGADTLGFKYIPTDGTSTPPGAYPDAIHLSGGQKIQLAIAFRFAAYCMFASKVGLLTLDEPTERLDARNVGNFCLIIEKIRDVAQKMNLQVFMATHETAVLPFLDSVINLNDTKIQ